MDDAAAVRIADRLADGQRSSQELLQSQTSLAWIARSFDRIMKAVDRLVEILALDESHRIVGLAAVVAPQVVNGHDAGMLEAAGDFGFQAEPVAAGRVAAGRLESA